MDRLAHRLRHRRLSDDGVGQLQAGDDGALLAHEHRLVQARPLERLEEQHAVEAAVGVLEARLLLDRTQHRRVGDGEPEIVRLLVERRLGDELRQNLPLQAHRPGLVRRQRPLELGLVALELVLVGGAHLLGRDRRLADRGNSRARSAAEKLLHAEDRDTRDQEGEDHREHDLAEPMLAGTANGLEHRTPGPRFLQTAPTRGGGGPYSSPAIDDRGGGAKGMCSARPNGNGTAAKVVCAPKLALLGPRTR